MQGLPFCTRALLLACVLCFPASHAWGYRPFVSTDAAVVDPKEVGIELGECTLERTQGEHTFTMPSLVVHDGLLTNIALVGELRVQESPTQTVDVVDLGLCVQAVLTEGVFQGEDGSSVAREAGPCCRPPGPASAGVASKASGCCVGVSPVHLAGASGRWWPAGWQGARRHLGRDWRVAGGANRQGSRRGQRRARPRGKAAACRAPRRALAPCCGQPRPRCGEQARAPGGSTGRSQQM